MRLLLLIFLSTALMPVLASDQKREQAYAEWIEKTLKIGEIVRLKADNQPFLGIYTETTRPGNLGTAIILHDKGSYPDNGGLIHLLRSALPEHRWATLSLQMPVYEAGAQDEDYYALFDQAKKRIDAAVRYLKKSGNQKIVLIGYGLGGQMGLYYAATKSDEIAAIVLISLPVVETDARPLQVLTFLREIPRPILDIYAENDLPEVSHSVRKRLEVTRNKQNYRQIKIISSDHSYHFNEDLLVKRIYSWLSRMLGQ